VVCLCTRGLPLRTQDFQGSGASDSVADRAQAAAGNILGTVVDVNNDTVPGATIVLEAPVLRDARTVLSNNNGFFEFNNLDPGATYHVTIRAQGFADWTPPGVMLKGGQ
jgi:Carboxypeptidase regulatory-like domain